MAFQRLFSAGFLMCLFAVASYAEENPLAKASVGDWITYVSSMKLPDAVLAKIPAAMREKLGDRKMEMRREVIKKTDTEITFENTTKTMGRDVKNTYTVDLTKKFEPHQNMQKKDAKVKELGNGTETVSVNDKNYETKWIEYEFTYTERGSDHTGNSKIWFSPEVPLGGMVKMEMDANTLQGGSVKMSWALQAFGNGK